MEHTRYIKFDFHDNDYHISAVEVVKRTFSWYMFSVDFCGFIVGKGIFEKRWEIFDDFIDSHYAGNVERFSNHLADMIILDTFTYNTISNDFDCYDDMIDYIKSSFAHGNYLNCDISFVNEIDTDEDWNSETIYLDMSTGYIEVR